MIKKGGDPAEMPRGGNEKKKFNGGSLLAEEKSGQIVKGQKKRWNEVSIERRGPIINVTRGDHLLVKGAWPRWSELIQS